MQHNIQGQAQLVVLRAAATPDEEAPLSVHSHPGASAVVHIHCIYILLPRHPECDALLSFYTCNTWETAAAALRSFLQQRPQQLLPRQPPRQAQPRAPGRAQVLSSQPLSQHFEIRAHPDEITDASQHDLLLWFHSLNAQAYELHD